MTADDLADWVEHSRNAQDLPARVTDPDSLAALAQLVHVARDAEAHRQAERHGQGPIRTTPVSGESDAA